MCSFHQQISKCHKNAKTHEALKFGFKSNLESKAFHTVQEFFGENLEITILKTDLLLTKSKLVNEWDDEEDMHISLLCIEVPKKWV